MQRASESTEFNSTKEVKHIPENNNMRRAKAVKGETIFDERYRERGVERGSTEDEIWSSRWMKEEEEMSILQQNGEENIRQLSNHSK